MKPMTFPSDEGRASQIKETPPMGKESLMSDLPQDTSAGTPPSEGADSWYGAEDWGSVCGPLVLEMPPRSALDGEREHFLLSEGSRSVLLAEMQHAIIDIDIAIYRVQEALNVLKKARNRIADSNEKHRSAAVDFWNWEPL
jgi:hypothetical protein